jgi:hypothetical protein
MSIRQLTPFTYVLQSIFNESIVRGRKKPGLRAYNFTMRYIRTEFGKLI